jgi:hypothetical protein
MIQPPPTPPVINGESSAVQSYLGILQAIISRMASNSGNCKTWCISLVSAILVVVADQKTANYAWIAFVPVLLFFLLDAYYLAQERAFRDVYNHFVAKLHAGHATDQDLFVVKPLQGFRVAQSLLVATGSFSIYPFYLVLAGIILIARYLL